VTGVDTTSKRIELSVKQLTADPYQELLKQFVSDQKVTGSVEKVTEQGVVFDLGVEGVEGFVRKEKIPPTTKYEDGQKVNLTVTEVDAKKHRVYLTPVLLEKPLMYR
ncbi:MAG: S1 RNA-binding domain-containing protein, partial [Patescibacteria group bacterium]|nr:S1 RNA-binding domain-containing protein [Patescibacteria group bacterium]